MAGCPIPSSPHPTTQQHTTHKPLYCLYKAKPPSTDDEYQLLWQKMGFKYRTAISKLVYMMVTCRVDISFAIMIKLHQFSNAPAEIHYEAVWQYFEYLAYIIDHGIYYWQDKPFNNLPDAPFLVSWQSYNYNQSTKSRQQYVCICQFWLG